MDYLEKENLTGKAHHQSKDNMNYLTVKSLLGDKVQNSNGETLGKVRDIMLDISKGKVDYLIVESGGFLGIGEKYFAYPWELVKVNLEKKVLEINQSKKALRNAPGFDPKHWPHTNDKHLSDSKIYWGDFIGSASSGVEPY